MKISTKICILTLLLSVTFAFAGCRNSEGQTFSEYLNENFPNIEYHESGYTFDANNREIAIIEGYTLNQGNSYEWVETENGYDLVIHFVEDGDQG